MRFSWLFLPSSPPQLLSLLALGPVFIMTLLESQGLLSWLRKWTPRSPSSRTSINLFVTRAGLEASTTVEVDVRHWSNGNSHPLHVSHLPTPCLSSTHSLSLIYPLPVSHLPTPCLSSTHPLSLIYPPPVSHLPTPCLSSTHPLSLIYPPPVSHLPTPCLSSTIPLQLLLSLLVVVSKTTSLLPLLLIPLSVTSLSLLSSLEATHHSPTTLTLAITTTLLMSSIFTLYLPWTISYPSHLLSPPTPSCSPVLPHSPLFCLLYPLASVTATHFHSCLFH